jgi:flagellar protein FlgJ
MNLTPIDPRTMLSATKPTLDPNRQKERNLEDLRQYTREFEAIYINEMFKAMRKTVPDGGLIGLGEAMFEQLKHLVAK